MSAHEAAGGFLPYSPPLSSISSSRSPQSLPQPRSSPLKPGGSKESHFIRYVDNQILHIQRRFAKRDASLVGQEGVREADEEGRIIEEVRDPATIKSEQWHDVPGYASFAEAARAVEKLVGEVWISGTPSLQIPYLISLALLTTTMIPAFPASPRQLFRLLGKLDHAFASLLQGRDIDTGDALPGFRASRGVSGTEKVRIKSLVERTRVCVVDVMAKGEYEEDEDADEDEHIESDLEGDLIMEEIDDGPGQAEDWNVQVAKVYDNTLVEIGDTMDGPAIGIRTEMAR